MSMIINKLLAAWHTKTPAEKAKMIFHGIIMIGGGVVGNTIGDKCSVGRGPVQSTCARVTGWALGGAVANVAAKSMDETIDSIDELIQSRKNNKEDAANA
jgi:hypothetical protein